MRLPLCANCSHYPGKPSGFFISPKPEVEHGADRQKPPLWHRILG